MLRQGLARSLHLPKRIATLAGTLDLNSGLCQEVVICSGEARRGGYSKITALMPDHLLAFVGDMRAHGR
jgi:hypothetical protein